MIIPTLSYFFAVFLFILLAPVFMCLSALSVMKFMELYGRYLDWVWKKLKEKS